MNTMKQAFETLANIAGGRIENDKFIEDELTTITKNLLNHDMQNFYCVAVPGLSLIHI